MVLPLMALTGPPGGAIPGWQPAPDHACPGCEPDEGAWGRGRDRHLTGPVRPGYVRAARTPARSRGPRSWLARPRWGPTRPGRPWQGERAVTSPPAGPLPLLALQSRRRA